MDYFTLAVGLLFLLALLDLSVGVSNDAVNFLNSAIGSQVARREVILAVASVGIICGALFSSGMMEVARKGIFNPGMFSFSEVMVIFLAVMITDVLLLDLFNTFALPTSTTVSIVFELLGAAVAVAGVQIVLAPSGGAELGAYINSSKALLIVSGIVLSVGIAFAVGCAVMFVTRVLFTFSRSRHGAGLVVAGSAVALSAIGYFLFIKGLKGAGFVPIDLRRWVDSNQLAFVAGQFGFWLAALHVARLAGLDLLRFVVLAGTFALAMAFASNDLVNFIGVPMAGLESWRAFQGGHVAADELMMSALARPVRGDTAWLAAAGVVMVITLWRSRKARSVTQTEVDLGRQDEGAERFRPGPLSRSLVRGWLGVSRWVAERLPRELRDRIGARFEMGDGDGDGVARGPAFDRVRASVNLTVASALIALATSLQLPLSTTYVSFMVAMGTSLADRAWGCDSAVYRVAGVVSVIGGWLLTAVIAFSAAALLALAIRLVGPPVVGVLVALAVAALWRSQRYHGRRVPRDARGETATTSPAARDHTVHAER